MLLMQLANYVHIGLDYGFDFEIEDTVGYYALAASEDDVDQKNSDLLKKPSD